MRRLLFFGLPLVLALSVISVTAVFINVSSGKGALQVTSIPQSEVYLNGKSIGKTPLCKCEPSDVLKVGDYTVSLVPQAPLRPFEHPVRIEKSVLTVVDRTFGRDTDSEGSIITLRPIRNKKTSEMLVLSFPSEAEVLLDSNLSGKTPIHLPNVTDSDHELRLTKEGYKEKAVRVKTVLGYKLEASVFLGLAKETSAPTTASGQVTPTPKKKQITILQTPTGFLRVRQEPSTSSLEIGRVTPGETFAVISETSGWFQIAFQDAKPGWVSAQYAKKE